MMFLGLHILPQIVELLIVLGATKSSAKTWQDTQIKSHTAKPQASHFWRWYQKLLEMAPEHITEGIAQHLQGKKCLLGSQNHEPVTWKTPHHMHSPPSHWGCSKNAYWMLRQQGHSVRPHFCSCNSRTCLKTGGKQDNGDSSGDKMPLRDNKGCHWWKTVFKIWFTLMYPSFLDLFTHNLKVYAHTLGVFLTKRIHQLSRDFHTPDLSLPLSPITESHPGIFCPSQRSILKLLDCPIGAFIWLIHCIHIHPRACISQTSHFVFYLMFESMVLPVASLLSVKRGFCHFNCWENHLRSGNSFQTPVFV